MLTRIVQALYANQQFTIDEMHNYRMAVTEREVALPKLGFWFSDRLRVHWSPGYQRMHISNKQWCEGSRHYLHENSPGKRLSYNYSCFDPLSRTSTCKTWRGPPHSLTFRTGALAVDSHPKMKLKGMLTRRLRCCWQITGMEGQGGRLWRARESTKGDTNPIHGTPPTVKKGTRLSGLDERVLLQRPTKNTLMISSTTSTRTL